MSIQPIRITPNVKQKYVLVRVMNGDTETLVIWGNPSIEWHKDIVEEIKNSNYEIVEVIGGGWLLQDVEENKIYVWGKSERYGVASISLVREVIKGEVIEAEPT